MTTIYIPYRSPAVVLRTVHAQVPAELYEDMEAEAAERHTSVSAIIRERCGRKAGA